MTRSSIAPMLTALLVASLGFSLSARAADAAIGAASEAPEMANTETQQLAEEDAQVKQLRCPDSTATRIKRSNSRCTSPGRVYTAEDIGRTGEVDIGRALQRLDPAISTNRF